MNCLLRRHLVAFVFGLSLITAAVGRSNAQEVQSPSSADSGLPAPQSLSTNLEPGASLTDATATTAPYQMVPMTPPAAPPTFPGPMVLPPVGPWKLMYFDNDFTSYKKDPNHEYLLGEELKDMPMELFGIPLTLSTGGEIRDRFMNEQNRLRPGGIPTGHTADYNLIRWRHYFDLRAGDFRFYVEGIDADSGGSALPNQPIDVNRWDLQNIFADWQFYDDGSNKQTVRYGRQELTYGKQRLVSPLDWANTRRNFQGGRYFAKGKDYQFDLFCVNPVNSATGYTTLANDANSFDSPNSQVFFSGAYLNYTGIQNTSIDAYWLYLDTNSYTNPSLPLGGRRHTMGGRYGALFPVDGGSRVWDFDTEGAIQFGEDPAGAAVLAGFFTAVGGHTWKEVPWTPRVSSTFYYASGTGTKGSTNHTFNTLFPLSHAYWGLSDNVNGENLFNYALQAEAKPTAKSSIVSAYHWFELASANDNLYTVSGSPLSGAAHGPGRNVGTALDLYGYYAFSKAVDVQLGYSWFFFGDYFQTAAGSRPTCTQLYLQTTYRY